ncbi:hypothetical protein ACVWXU_001483 [Streptomyces sp. TE33382]
MARPARTPTPPWVSSSRRWRSSRSRATILLRGQCGRAASRAATIRNASARLPHSFIRCRALDGSLWIRSVPRIRLSSCNACSVENTSTWTELVPSRPASRDRLVIRTGQVDDPGNSQRTCSSSIASSRTMSIRRSATRFRNSSARSSMLDGMAEPRTPRLRRKRSRMRVGRIGWAEGPLSLANIWPSGNRCARECPRCTARVLLPTPPLPVIETIRRAYGVSVASSSAASSLASRSSRPVKSAIAPGSSRGTAGGPAKLAAAVGAGADAGAGDTAGASGAAGVAGTAGAAGGVLTGCAPSDRPDRIDSCSRRSSSPGSMPSSSISSRRPRR